MRTGEEYREALRDGRRVWVIGEGLVEDVTVHPATRATVDEYVAWYDRHFDPEWQDVLLTPPDAQGARAPWAFALPRSVQDLRAMGRSFSATTFLSAGNITHTPAYGNLIALGILDAVQQRNVSTEQIANATFTVPVAAPGVTVLCRKIAPRHPNPFLSPLSSRFDELDGQMWLDDVFIPWEHVFLMDVTPEPMASWLFWHQLYCWLSKAEFTLGLALACTHAMGLVEHEPTIEYLLDLVVDVQTVRSCQTAAELDPELTAEGYCIPGRGHIAAGSIAMQKARQRMAEILRILPGSSLVVAPSDKDLAAPEVGAGLEESFAGGGYTALQRSALLQLACDHVASALDGRESAFELHANGGIPAWRGRIRRSFSRYNELANGVLKSLSLDMPAIDLDGLRTFTPAPRRVVTPPKA